MRSLGRVSLALCAAVLLAPLASGCVHHHYSSQPRTPQAREQGPPPWAPAHGHRRKHHGNVEMVYNTQLGVYVVIGYPDHFYHQHSYYRYDGGGWLVSAQITGPWIATKVGDLPPGLRAKHVKKKRGHGHVHPASPAER